MEFGKTKKKKKFFKFFFSQQELVRGYIRVTCPVALSHSGLKIQVNGM